MKTLSGRFLENRQSDFNQILNKNSLSCVDYVDLNLNLLVEKYRRSNFLKICYFELHYFFNALAHVIVFL